MASCIRVPAVLVLLCLAFAPTVAAEEVAPYGQLPADRVLYVAPGQTLDELVRRAYPERADSWARIRDWIVEQNPHAFIDADPDRLRGEVRLRLPRSSAFAARQRAERPEREQSFRFVFEQRYLFVDPAQTLAELVPRTYPEAPLRWGEIIEAIQKQNGRELAARDARRTIARGTRLSIPDMVEDRGEPEPEPIVGHVTRVSGSVRATDLLDRSRRLATGGAVRRGDRITTGADAAARIEMDDGEELRLRADSRVRLRRWSLPETGPGQRVVELLAGGLRAITGAISNRSGDDYRTVAATATMGVRGTDYALRVCEPGECTAAAGGVVPAGLYIGVAEGEVELLNAGGELRFVAGEYGYVASADVAPTRVAADSAPVLYSADEPGAGASEAAQDQDGPSWWWAAGLLLLLAL